MQPFPPTIVLRHRKENLKKCSLKGLESRPDFNFYTYPFTSLPDLSGYLLLAVDAPPLTKEDTDHGIFIVDATWRYAAQMLKHPGLQGMERRSIPSDFRTAYPRYQHDCPDPERGLASIEAIYIAYLSLGRPVDGLLDSYYWKDHFLQKNDLIKKES